MTKVTFSFDLPDDFSHRAVDMVKDSLLKQLVSDTSGVRTGDVTCVVGDVVPTDNTPVAELMRLLPTYNTVGATLESYKGNLDLWREDMDTIREWYLGRIGGEG